MTTSELVSFPGLGLELTIDRVAFSIGGYNIYWYGILFALGFALGLWYFSSHCRQMGIHSYDGFDVILWAVVGGMIVARLYYVVFQWDYYKDNLLKIFALREGGLAFYGGVIGAVLAGWIASRIKKLPILPLLDAGLPGLMLAQAIGRWGNFFNQEAFGGNTTLPWGMISASTTRYLTQMQGTLAAQGMTVDPAACVHPTFLYESLWNLLGFALIVFLLNKHRRYDGEISIFYLAWNGFGRMLIEGLRTDSLMWGSVRVSQAFGALLFVGGAAVMILMRLRGRKPTAAACAPVAEEAPVPADSEAQIVPEKTPRHSLFDRYCDTEESKARIAATQKKLDEENAKHTEKKAARAQAPVEAPAAAAADAQEPQGPADGIDAADAPEEQAQVGIPEETAPDETDD